MPKVSKIFDWRGRYEQQSAENIHFLLKLSEAQLLNRIRKRQFDPYFSIWRAIGKKGSLENAAPVLIKYLKEAKGKTNMLNRYNCAGALFSLMGEKDYSKDGLRAKVQWGHQGEEARQLAINHLEEKIKGMVHAAD